MEDDEEQTTFTDREFQFAKESNNDCITTTWEGNWAMVGEEGVNNKTTTSTRGTVPESVIFGGGKRKIGFVSFRDSKYGGKLMALHSPLRKLRAAQVIPAGKESTSPCSKGAVSVIGARYEGKPLWLRIVSGTEPMRLQPPGPASVNGMDSSKLSSSPVQELFFLSPGGCGLQVWGLPITLPSGLPEVAAPSNNRTETVERGALAKQATRDRKLVKSLVKTVLRDGAQPKPVLKWANSQNRR